jgi:hypothetical protein
MVTFEVIDPLFTLDLSDPTDPRVVGELEVTGYSSYLHPVDADHLLAVGMEATDEGRILGLAVSVFDVSDFANPTLAHRYLIEDQSNMWSWSEALYDHHAFTFHRGVLSIPAYVRSGQQLFAGLLVMAVDADDGIWEIGRVNHGVLPPCRSSHVVMRRSVYIEEFLFALSSRGLSVSTLANPELFLRLVSLCGP